MTRRGSYLGPPMFRPCISEAARPARGRAPSGVGTLALVTGLAIVGMLLLSSLAVVSTPAAPLARAPSFASADASVLAGAAPAPATAPSASDLPCYSINQTLCLSMANASEPNILPNAGSHTTNVEPSANTTLSLYLKSMKQLVWPSFKTSGPTSPIALNATGTLWNGDPFYNATDGTMWHPSGSSWWQFGPTGSNVTYPYWYLLNFSAKSATGQANFFPGMRLTWWVYIVSNSSNVYSHWSSISFSFTFAGAWPFSPYPGSAQYAGPGAASEDLVLTQNPLRPNYDDSVNVTIATTAADTLPAATIGGAYLAYSEFAPDGALLAQATLTFPVSLAGTVGAEESEVQLPPYLAHEPNALVEYQVTAWDTNTFGPDQIETGSFNYTVNGNGSFVDHAFSNDLALVTTPAAPGLGGTPSPVVAAGTSVRLLLSSRNLGTAIYAAEAVYNVTYPALNETATGTVTLGRLNSTNFVGSLPAMPLGSVVTFQVLAWDFSQYREQSTTYSFTTPTVGSLVDRVPTNSTFFLVYVYDNGTHRWVSGASVSIVGVSGYLRTNATTFDGVAYPNATASPFVPLLLPAGATYKISVSDPSFAPPSGSTPSSVSVELPAPHNLTTEGTLLVGADYEVAQSGDSIYFWLNQTAPSATYSSPVAIGAAPLIGAGIGLGAIALCLLPLMMWWSKIRARRLAQEKRITL